MSSDSSANRALTATAAFLFAIQASNARATGDCPVATLRCDYNVCSPPVEVTIKEPEGGLNCPVDGGLLMSASVNRVSGMLAASGFDPFCVSGGAGAQAIDDYTLHGLPAGTPVTFAARLILSGNGCSTFSGSGGCSVNISDGIIADGAHVGAAPDQGCVTGADSAQIVLTRRVGTPFRLHLDIWAGGIEGGSGSGGASLRFADLPPGVFVTSCHGFEQGTATPTARWTWGRLKTIYRD